ncbi:MAG: glycoside hydrolase family 3 N-terminal domain-containing protein [Flavisolibacter sp.]
MFAQYNSKLSAGPWVDSVLGTLSKKEKIGQLIIIRAHSDRDQQSVAAVAGLIQKYKIGSLCFFQGGPVRQANLTNYYQSIAKTPLLICQDAEYGLGMRLDSVLKFPYQLSLGALKDDSIIYEMGRAVALQLKRMGVHINFAPVADINNNPANPVIGFRSFGEDKYKVARFSVAYMKAMQKEGILACAKHFPGHGDVSVDSHLDLPVIYKTRTQLDSLELYPFQQLIKSGVGGIMMAHLFIPSVDSTPNRPTSLSYRAVTTLLKDDLKYDRLVFTDALEMKGVTKYFPSGDAALQALIAGNDLLCLPENVGDAMKALRKAVRKRKISKNDLNQKVKKILYAKYQLGLNRKQFIDTTNLTNDLNANTLKINLEVARNNITVLKNEGSLFPLTGREKIAYIGLGEELPTILGKRLEQQLKADSYYLSYGDSAIKAASLKEVIVKNNYDKIIIGVHHLNLHPAGNYGISQTAKDFWTSLQGHKTLTLVFGNVYALQNFCDAKALVAFYQDDERIEHLAADFIEGKMGSKGVLPVSVCNLAYGTAIPMERFAPKGNAAPWLVVDSIVRDALLKKAFPGCQVLALHNGVIKYHKAFGNYEYGTASQPVSLESIYDLASLTKISATTVAVMKLYEEGKLDIQKTLGDYLPFTKNSDKAGLKLYDVLLHQAGLIPDVIFYKETLETGTDRPSEKYYKPQPDQTFNLPVARDLYLRRDWEDTMLKRIVQSPLTEMGKYIYSDNDFILLGKIVENLSGLPLDQYVAKTFYSPLGMTTTGFNPIKRFALDRVVPTEEDKYFRHQLLRGFVHDEGAAMFGGLAGHAGLFSNAYDLSLLYQMLLNGGELNGQRFLKPETIKYFTSYHSNISRRALGFDKPEKDNIAGKEPYPSVGASPETFGHTGFTGTCVWVDPQSKLVYIFLSNRVYESRNNNLLSVLNIRSKILDAIYQAIRSEAADGTLQ